MLTYFTLENSLILNKGYAKHFQPFSKILYWKFFYPRPFCFKTWTFKTNFQDCQRTKSLTLETEIWNFKKIDSFSLFPSGIILKKFLVKLQGLDSVVRPQRFMYWECSPNVQITDIYQKSYPNQTNVGLIINIFRSLNLLYRSKMRSTNAKIWTYIEKRTLTEIPSVKAINLFQNWDP